VSQKVSFISNFDKNCDFEEFLQPIKKETIDLDLKEIEMRNAIEFNELAEDNFFILE
jgi:hypothetical protein